MSNINVNNITPTSGNKVSVSGSLHASGDITANGNIVLGNANTDNITLNAEISSSIIPDADITYDLGSTSKQWQTIHANSASLNFLDVDDTLIVNSIIVTGSNTLTNWGNFKNRMPSDNRYFTVTTDPTFPGGWRHGLATPGNTTGSAPHMQFQLSGSGQAGIGLLNPKHTLHVSTSNAAWKALYVEGTSQFTGQITATTLTATSGTFGYLSGSSPITTAAPLQPDVTNTHDIGTSALQFKDLYVDGVGHIDTLSGVASASIDVLSVNSNISSSLIPAQNLPHLTAPEHDLGASDKLWKNVYAATGSFGELSGSINFSNAVTFQNITATTTTATSGTFSYLTGSSPITTAAPLHPDVTNTHDIGTSALQFKDLYVDGVGHIDKIQAGDATIAQVGTGAANININSISTASLYTSASLSDIRFENLPTTPSLVTGSLWASGSSIAHPGSSYLMIVTG